MKIPTESMCCIALVKPSSKLSYDWSLQKPTYGIYEYSKAFGTREIRFGDGSWQSLTDEAHDDLVLLAEAGEELVDQLFAGV